MLFSKKCQEGKSLPEIAHSFFNNVKEKHAKVPTWPALATKYKLEPNKKNKDVETPPQDEVAMDLNDTTVKDSVVIAQGFKEGGLVQLDQRKSKYEVNATVFKITGFDEQHVLLKDASSTGPTDHRR